MDQGLSTSASGPFFCFASLAVVLNNFHRDPNILFIRCKLKLTHCVRQSDVFLNGDRNSRSLLDLTVKDF